MCKVVIFVLPYKGVLCFFGVALQHLVGLGGARGRPPLRVLFCSLAAELVVEGAQASEANPALSSWTQGFSRGFARVFLFFRGLSRFFFSRAF